MCTKEPKKYCVKMKNGLELHIKQYRSPEVYYGSLWRAYYLGGKALTKFTRTSIKELAAAVKVSPLKMGHFLGYDVSAPVTKGRLETV